MSVLGLLLVLDLSRPWEKQWLLRGELAAIEQYRKLGSPWLLRLGVRCRFHPSCSEYALWVLRADGFLLGNGRVLWRLLRCGPWTPKATLDLPRGVTGVETGKEAMAEPKRPSSRTQEMRCTIQSGV